MTQEAIVDKVKRMKFKYKEKLMATDNYCNFNYYKGCIESLDELLEEIE